MGEVDYEAEISLLLTEMQGDQGEAHEIFMRVNQITSMMRAEGLPIPEPLENFMQALDQEFTETAQTKSVGESL